LTSGRDVDRWDLAFHRDDFTLPRPVRDVDIAWRGPDGRMQTVPMRIDDLRGWYRRELELNLEASQRLWDAMRRDYQERTGIPWRVEGDPGPWIFAGAHRDAVVDQRMAAWRWENGQEEPFLGRPASADALHAEAGRLEDVLLGAHRSERVGEPEDDAWLGRVERQYQGVMSRIGARGARPGETVDDYLARTSIERLVEGGPPPSRPYLPPESRQVQTQGQSPAEPVLAKGHRGEGGTPRAHLADLGGSGGAYETPDPPLGPLSERGLRSGCASPELSRPGVVGVHGTPYEPVDEETGGAVEELRREEELDRFLYDPEAWESQATDEMREAMMEELDARLAGERRCARTPAPPTGRRSTTASSAADLTARGTA
jgi:hypothetical protein